MTDCLTNWRAEFSNQIQQPGLSEDLKRAALSEELSSWTSSLTTAVVRSCESLGWDAAAKWNSSNRLPQPGKEYLSIDVTALPSKEERDIPWPLPAAVFELENHRKDVRVAYSLWKVLCVRVMLRVVIAFRPDWERTRQLVGHLQEQVIGGLTPEQRVTLGGETVVVVGNRGEGETFPWGYFKFWRLDTNLGRFEKA